MNTIFTMDAMDYDPDWPVFVRDSARGIHLRDGKLLLMHLRKIDAFKLPGGGIEPGESPEQALIREVQEESGRRVIPSSIQPFGAVLVRRAGSRGEEIFQQTSFHYFIDVEESIESQRLDGYEEELGFQPVYLPIAEAIERSKRALPNSAVRSIPREIRVMECLLRWLSDSK